MRQHNISAYIIPATDPHMGGYLAERERRRQWLTGFTGSSGTAAVTLTRAAVFTDSRYWIQAERQMDCNWELQKILSTSEIVSWILPQLNDGDEIGFDPFLFSIGGSIETIARQALWEVGLNYGHGTGHGIGNFFAVHEWPVGLQTNNIALQKGMFTSIEPGYYHDGHFGIRIEDIAVVVEAETKVTCH
ncbi:hypothetical protein GDO81_020003 [Engystomops pustulosus]|nr:hypothetical protein GDO81_020003 [Engystomops pustulosus]